MLRALTGIDVTFDGVSQEPIDTKIFNPSTKKPASLVTPFHENDDIKGSIRVLTRVVVVRLLAHYQQNKPGLLGVILNI